MQPLLYINQPLLYINKGTQHPIHKNMTHLAISWDKVECVFLDMDGTLLDLNYDNHVWNDLFPAAYAKQQRISVDEAKAFLLNHMRDIRGTIDFYNIDYWADLTRLDMIALHSQATRLLNYRAGAEAFLHWLRAQGIKTVIATNAHRASIAIKDAHTQICAAVDHVVSSHDFGVPKESIGFWQTLFHQHAHTPGACVCVDDNEPVLEAAQRSGMGHVLGINTPDSQRPSRTDMVCPHFDHFEEICPAIAT